MMEEHYHPHKIEEDAQKFWAKNDSFAVTEREDKEKYYCLP